MEPVPANYINAIPETVEADRESCTIAADNTLLALFFLASQKEGEWESFPLILSNGVEVWPLPAPWTSRDENKLQLLQNLNGQGNREGYLTHCKKNCVEFNEALASNDLPLANRILAVTPQDSAAIWNDCNALAFTVETANVYRPLSLSDGTKEVFEEI
jgi:hypothetical protein